MFRGSLRRGVALACVAGALALQLGAAAFGACAQRAPPRPALAHLSVAMPSNAVNPSLACAPAPDRAAPQ